MPASRTTHVISSGLITLCLAGCGGGEVSGVLSGLGELRSMMLLNNGGDALTLRSNGSFAFADRLSADEAYAVTVQAQPAGQSCTVSNGSGTIDANGDAVDEVRVSCVFTASVRGTVTGLVAGTALTLINRNGNVRLLVASDGAFAFPETLADGTAYDVRVEMQPAASTCTVTDGSGTFVAAGFRDVAVVCV